MASSSTNENCKIGRLKCNGKADVCTYVICNVKGATEGEQKESAEKVCSLLFSGDKPKPSVGWWNKNSDWKPKAIISVTGGAGKLELSTEKRENQEFMDVISDGIVKTAHIFKAMIVDGGSNSGVMKLIGEAVVRDGNRIATLGIFPFGAVARLKSELEAEISFGVHSVDDGIDVRTTVDRNHHYFALIDEGTVGDDAYGKEIPMRYHIEFALSKLKESPTKSDDEKSGSHGSVGCCLWDQSGAKNQSGTSSQIPQAPASEIHSLKGPVILPHVLVVVNGGPGTLSTVFKLSQVDKLKGHEPIDRIIPIVVLKGTGRAADLIAEAWEIHKRSKTTLTEDERKQLEAKFDKSFPSPKEISKEEPITDETMKKWQDQKDETMECLERFCNENNRDNDVITIHDMKNSHHTLAYTIMKSVCTGSLMKKGGGKLGRLDAIDQLALVFSWDIEKGTEAIEMAIEEIMSKHASGFGSTDLTDLLVNALKKNQVRFVEMLLDYDVTIPDVNDSLYGKDTARLHEAIRTRLCSLIRFRKGEFWKGKSLREGDDAVLNPNELLKYVMGWEEFIEFVDTKDGTREHTKAGTREHLFLWCILTCRTDMAELLWRKCHPDMRQHCISRALFACAIARTLSPYLPTKLGEMFSADEQDSKKDGEAHPSDLASRFEGIAMDLLDRCYKESPQDAILSLTCPLLHPTQCVWIDKIFSGSPVLYGNAKHSLLTPIMLAYDAQAELFVEHAAFQECLDQIWYGRLVTLKDHSGKEKIRGFRVHTQGCLSWLFRGGMFEDMEEAFLMFDIFFLAVLGFLVPACESSQAGAKSNQNNLCISLGKVLAFYSSPIVKFYLDFASYLTFLVIYTYVGINMEFRYTVLEGVMHAWIIALIVNEVRDYHVFGKRYITSISNVLDIIILLFYVPAFVLRIYDFHRYDMTEFSELGGGNQTNQHNELHAQLQQGKVAYYDTGGFEFIQARSWHGMAGILFWIRITDFFRVSRKLGPLMLVLIKVFGDAFQFFVILLIFMVSFGAAMICAARPRHDPSISMAGYFDQMIFFPYLEIFGEHFLNGFPLSFDDYPLCDTQSGSTVTCSPSGKLGVILLCIYLFVSGILLMNLLIAMMNSSYEQVFEKSTRAWKLQRLEFVLSYSSKPILLLPASIIFSIWELLELIISDYIGSGIDGYTACSGNKKPNSIHMREARMREYAALELSVKRYQEDKNAKPTAGESKGDAAADKSASASEGVSTPEITGDLGHASVNQASGAAQMSCATSPRQFSQVLSDCLKKAEEDVKKYQTDKFTIFRAKHLGDMKRLMDKEVQGGTDFESKLQLKKLSEALEGFRNGMTVGDILYMHEEIMASLYQDVFLEPWWLQNFLDGLQNCSDDPLGRPAPLEEARAKAMRKCVNIAAGQAANWKSKGEESPKSSK